ncbi:hypothetical protein [Bacillus sp. OK048]|uniref:hypothetical protein n=1 Tax=Bacillus sp. OK048 TaxID=1882761 RepID=UPI00088400F6|nr:hypothetical protein [Bacillus sp. OK048]SDN38323.1 hypothetical protein SAMN05443253_11138 [Bacillus sp. OK048]
MRSIAALFSMLMPGFGQIYNRQFIKGVLLIIVEHYDNVMGKINTAIHLDFNGFHQNALESANFQYVLFYPGFYAYTVWDAWYFAKPNVDKTKSAIPFIIGGFLGEFGAIYANRLSIPTLMVGLLMIIPMVIGMIAFRNH